jgi:methionine-gamma-lyase
MNESTPLQRLRDLQHFGEEGGVVPVVDVAATSTFLKPEDMERTFRGEMHGCYLYSRHSNPSVQAFSKKLAALEGAEAALGFASGMAAVSCTIEQMMPNGGEIVAARSVYGGTYALLANVLPRRGFSVKWVNQDSIADIEAAIGPKTKLIYTETLSNPMLGFCDLKKVGELAKLKKVKWVIDNTFVPLIASPLDFGADAVIYSATKYLGGSADLIAGAVVSTQAFIDSLIDVNTGEAMLRGPVMDARIAHELYTRLDHLGPRIKAHSEMAIHMARAFEQAKVPVTYPGLESHQHHVLMASQMRKEFGFGGMMTVDCGKRERAFALAEKLQAAKFGLYAVSLGFSRTLMSIPSVSTSSEIPEVDQVKMGLKPGLLRLSIGYTGEAEVMTRRFLEAWKSL